MNSSCWLRFRWWVLRICLIIFMAFGLIELIGVIAGWNMRYFHYAVIPVGLATVAFGFCQTLGYFEFGSGFLLLMGTFAGIFLSGMLDRNLSFDISTAGAFFGIVISGILMLDGLGRIKSKAEADRETAMKFAEHIVIDSTSGSGVTGQANPER